MKRLCAGLFTAALLFSQEPTPRRASRGVRITEINAKIAEHQRAIDRLEEEKRRLMDVPDLAAESRSEGEQPRTLVGPRNGRYHYDSKGRKVYDRRSLPDRSGAR